MQFISGRLNKDKQKTIGEPKHEHKFKTITHFSESCFYMFTYYEQCFYGIIIAMEALIKNGIIKINKYVLHSKVRNI